MEVPQQAGPLLRRARHLARKTQVEFASVCGVHPTVISAYETGRRAPSLATLRRLVRAAGFDLILDLVDAVGDGDTALLGPHGMRLRRDRDAIIEALARHGFTNPWVVGRVASGTEREFDRVELLVDPVSEGTVDDRRMSSACGSLWVYLPSGVILHVSTELEPEELSELLAGAVPLVLPPGPPA